MQLGQLTVGPMTRRRRLAWGSIDAPPLQSARPCPLVTTCDREAVMKNANMSEEMQQDSVERATQELEK